MMCPLLSHRLLVLANLLSKLCLRMLKLLLVSPVSLGCFGLFLLCD